MSPDGAVLPLDTLSNTKLPNFRALCIGRLTTVPSGCSTLLTLQCAQPLQQPDHGSYGVGTGIGTDSSGGGTDSSGGGADSSGGGTDCSGAGAGELTAGDSGGVGTGEMATGGFAGAADGCEGRHA